MVGAAPPSLRIGFLDASQLSTTTFLVLDLRSSLFLCPSLLSKHDNRLSAPFSPSAFQRDRERRPSSSSRRLQP